LRGLAFVLSSSSVEASASRACSISRWMLSGSRATVPPSPASPVANRRGRRRRAHAGPPVRDHQGRHSPPGGPRRPGTP